MPSKHHFKLSTLPPQEKSEAGYRIRADKANFSALQGMSLYKLRLEAKGVREPHWHANADELGYCLKGQVLVSLYHTGDITATFLVQEGEVFFVPSGALHGIETVGSEPAELVLCFSNEKTEDFNLSSSLGVFSDAVLGNTWGVDKEVFHGFVRSTNSVFAALREEAPDVPDEARYVTPYRYSLEAAQPILTNDGGSARMARQNMWPMLQRQALYSLRLTGAGMREPHWHPETAELGYVAKGKGRMSIQSPSGEVDTYVMEEGDIYFIPRAYPHHIENLLGTDLHLLIFFDQSMPRDIGFTGSIRSFSDEALGAVMKQKPSFFEQLNKYYADLFIVKKDNPLDPS